MPTATANGRKFTFPDGTTPEQMGQAIDEFFGEQSSNNLAIRSDSRFADIPASSGGRFGDIARDAQEQQLRRTLEFEQLPQEIQNLVNSVSPAEAFLIGAGRGFENLARGVNLVDPEPGKDRAIENLKRKRGISTGAGELVGETAPFVAPATAIGGISSLAGRTAASGALGAIEAGIITSGRGGESEDVLANAGLAAAAAATLELGLPVVGRVAGTLFRRIKGKPPAGALITESGTPTQEFAEALDEAGIGFDEVVNEARRAAETPVDPQQAARSALFEDLEAPALKGDITQQFSDQAADQRLVGSASDPVSDPARQIRLEQSEAFSNRLDEQIKASGVPEDVGESIKDALISRKELLREEKNLLYKKAAEQAEDVGELPILTDGIEGAIPDRRTVRRISRLQGSQVNALDDLLVEFGIVRDSGKVKTFLDSGGEIEPLSLKNIEEFRAAINQIERADSTNAINVLTGPIKKALDDEADNILDTIGGPSLEAFREARGVTKQLKQEFSPQSITGRLTDLKRDGITPVIESSKVYKELVTKEPELLERTLSSLRSAGDKGSKAIGDLQAAVIYDLLENAFKANTRKIQGTKTFGAVAFNNRLKQIGDERLKEIFKNRQSILSQIRKVGKAAELITPDNRAVPKGSADVVLDRVVPILERIPGTRKVTGGLRVIIENGKNKADLQRALNAKPEVRKIATTINTQFPALAIALGIPAALEEE